MSLSVSARPARLLRLVALLSFALASPVAWSQAYKSDAMEGRLSSRGAIARNYVKRGVGERQEFNDYIEKYFFPAMTQPSAEGLQDLGKLHGDLFKNFLYAATGETQTYLHNQTLAFAIRVLKDRRYHPSVRYNALLVLGKLDDKYPSGNEPPVPSAKANDLLCALAGRAATNARSPRYELAGSLVGLERHTRYFGSLPGPQKQKTAATLYKILTTDELAGEYAPGVRDWIYLQAGSAVANLGTAGPSGGVFASALGKRLSDGSLSLETRAALAGLLPRLNLKAGQVTNAEPLVKSVTDLAVAISKEEAEVATKFENMQLRGGQRMTAGRGKMARRLEETQDRGVKLVREGLLVVLTDLRRGVRGVKPIADEASQPNVAAMDEAISDAIRSAGDKDVIDLNVTDAIKRMANRIEGAAAPALAVAE